MDDLSEFGSNCSCDNTDHSDSACELCDEDHSATMRCLDCRQNMCDIAVKLHRRTKSTKSHRLMPVHDCIDEDGSSIRETDMCIVCPLHQDTYRYFDRDCGHCICRDCFALTHTGHKCVTSGVAAKEFRSELEKSNKEVKLKIESFQGAEKVLEEINRNLGIRYNELNEKLETTFEQVSFISILLNILFELIFFPLALQCIACSSQSPSGRTTWPVQSKGCNCSRTTRKVAQHEKIVRKDRQ